MNRVHVHPRSDTQRCPLCHQEVSGRSCPCPVCATRYHLECTRELGRTCAVLGCQGKLLSDPEPERVEFLGARDRRFGRAAAPRPRAVGVEEPLELPGVLARAWDQFSLLHFGCGVIFFVPFAMLLVGRAAGYYGGGTFKLAAAIGLVLAVAAGWKQDAFWYGFFNNSGWRSRRW
ncbi:MAG: hypothetical protein R3F62_24705 [Planctomycetota bacterium]